MGKVGESTFLRITNQDIYKLIQDNDKVNREEHSILSENQIRTNGKVKLNRWISTTAITLFVVLLGFFIRH